MYRMIPFIQNQSYKKFMDTHICLLYRHITCTHMNGLNTIFIPVVTSGKEEEQKSLLKGIPTVSHVFNSEKDLKKILHFYTCKLVAVRLPLNYSCFFTCVCSIFNICKGSVCPCASKHSFWTWHYHISRTWTQSTEFGAVTQEHLWLSCTAQLPDPLDRWTVPQAGVTSRGVTCTQQALTCEQCLSSV